MQGVVINWSPVKHIALCMCHSLLEHPPLGELVRYTVGIQVCGQFMYQTDHTYKMECSNHFNL